MNAEVLDVFFAGSGNFKTSGKCDIRGSDYFVLLHKIRNLFPVSVLCT